MVDSFHMITPATLVKKCDFINQPNEMKRIFRLTDQSQVRELTLSHGFYQVVEAMEMSGIGLDTGLMTTGECFVENYWNFGPMLLKGQLQPQVTSV